MQIVFAVLGWILIIIVALLIFALILPVFIYTEYKNNEFSVVVRAFFIKFKVYPAQKKDKPKKEKQQKETAPKEDKPKEKTKKGLRLYADDIVEIIETAGSAIKKIFRGISFKDISATIPIHSEDAADTAINYGKMHAYVGGVYSTLKNILHIDVKNIDIICDFNNNFKNSTYFYCKIGAVPIIIVIALVYVLIRLKRKDVL